MNHKSFSFHKIFFLYPPSVIEKLARELKKAGIQFTFININTKETFLKALKKFQPTLIISDYFLPTFDGMQALKLTLKHDFLIPFIILTGSMNEDTAISCINAGATDYVIKEHITCLPYAAQEALEQKVL